MAETSKNKIPGEKRDISVNSKEIGGPSVSQKEKRIPNTELIPPSRFQVPIQKQEDPWKSLSKVTNDLLQLRLEYEALKAKKPEPEPAPVQPLQVPKALIAAPDEIRAHIDVHHPSSRQQSDWLPLNDIITRQATEIANLKSELKCQCEKQNEELSRLNREMLSQERNLERQIADLERDLQNTESSYQKQISEMTSQGETQKEAARSRQSQLEDKISELTNELSHRTKTLNDQNRELKQQNEKIVEDLKSQEKDKSSEMRKLEDQISQLKVYLSECQQTSKSNELWRQQTEELSTKLKTALGEKDAIESKLELQDVRLKSTQEILSIQETALCKGEKDQSNKLNSLLTRWREKVFVLLIQQKSSDLVSKKDAQNYQEKIAGLEQKLSEAEGKVQVLTHTISDLQAQLDIQCNDNKVLQNEITNSQQVALMLDAKNNKEVEHVTKLTQFAEQVQSGLEGLNTQWEMSLQSFSTLNQRLSFASGRVEILQAQFARKQALTRLHHGSVLPSRDDNLSTRSTQTEDVSGTVYNSELEQVTLERDSLAAQVKNDAQAMETKYNTIKHQYDTAVEDMQRRMRDLNEERDHATQKYDAICAELDKVNVSRQELEETVNGLRLDIKRLKADHEKDVDRSRRDERGKMEEEFRQIEIKLNDALKEQTKAIVQSRQVERQAARDKTRATEALKSLQMTYEDTIQQLHTQIRTIDAERNMLMATVKQEGLIGKYKSQHPPPVDSSDTSTDTHQLKTFQTETLKQRTRTHEDTPKGENKDTREGAIGLGDMLQDVRTLAAELVSSSDEQPQ
ncbi:unnamed protein product [Owenia fusiformis]|uniref:Coiled-coil alpha-helical rod protein 1 n=1 Tax=Owenia fusiformis TaxID=6347 RepID=A0A8J1U6H1_OWEFU|nr:unnamed protein product [Owenia fusiformis]